MSTARLDCVPSVDIDPSGVFKYILIKVHDPAIDHEDSSITIVRGYQRCNYHSDIFDEVKLSYCIFCKSHLIKLIGNYLKETLR